MTYFKYRVARNNILDSEFNNFGRNHVSLTIFEQTSSHFILRLTGRSTQEGHHCVY